MVRNLIEYGIKYPIVVNIVMGVLCLVGLASLSNIKSTFFPNVPPIAIIVEIVYPGASPKEVEEGVVFKIEENIEGIQGIDRVRSESEENRARLIIELDHGTDENLAVQDIRDAIDKVKNFPSEMEPPVIFDMEVFNFAYSFGLSGDVSLPRLKNIADKVKDDLMRSPSISQVSITGYPDREIEIAIDESSLRKYQLSFQEIETAVSQSNIDLSGGSIKTKDEEILLRTRSKSYTAAGLEDIPIRVSPSGQTIYLKDVADIRDRWVDNPVRGFIDQNPAAIIKISTTSEEDVFDAVESAKTYLEDLNNRQSEVTATTIQDYSNTLQERLDLLIKNGLIGAVLILFFLAFFLHFRLAFWVALGIPISFLSMFILFQFFGYTINVISLFGMIIVIGILVDDAVIVAENIYKFHEQGYSRIEAAKKGTFQVLPSIVSAILTTVVIFSIFFFIEGAVGNIFSDISFVVITTLLVSLVEALFILPAHVAHSKALDRNTKQNGVMRFSTGFLRFLINKVYSPVLKFVLEYRMSSLVLAVGSLVFMISLVKAGHVKTTFFPVIEQDNIIVRLDMPYGTREHLTREALNAIEAAARKVSKDNESEPQGSGLVKQVEMSIGPLANQGYINILLKDATERSVGSFEIVGRIRDEVGQLQGAESVIFTTDSPFGKPLSMSITGDDLDDVRAVKNTLRAKLQSMPELKDITDSDLLGKKEVLITLKPKAQQLGLTLGRIMGQIRAGFYGAEIQNLQVGGDEVKVWVRYKEDYRKDLAALEEMRFRVKAGQEYKLSELADLEVSRGPLAIRHLNGFREILLESEIANATVSVPELISKLEEEVIPLVLAPYPGVKVGFEGQSRETAKTAASAARVLPMLLILTFALIALVFRSFSQMLAVLLLIPFSVMGVILGHYIHGAQLGILSILGIIALIGVLVNDSLVYISALNVKLKEGLKYKEAIYQTGLERFRPILLTSLTTVAGLSPLILEKSFQAQFLIPMAISLAYGLAFATFLTWFLLPTFLLYLNDAKFYFSWLWNGKKPIREELEAAVREDIERI